MKKLLIPVAVLALTAAACGGKGDRSGTASQAPTTAEPTTHTLTVNFLAPGPLSQSYYAHGYWAFPSNGSCSATPVAGGGAYASPRFDSSVQVTVAGNDGTTLGLANIPDKGEWQGKTLKGTCTWTVSIDSLPESSFYKLTVTGVGEKDYALSDLVSHNWTISIGLPDSA